MKKIIFGALMGFALGSLGACGSKRTAATPKTATTVTGAVALVASGVAETGAGMQASALFSQQLTKMSLTPFSGGFSPNFATVPFEKALCDTRTGSGQGHGYPMRDANTRMNSTDPEYPLGITYCYVTINDGDTIRGGFEMARSLICTLEKGGITFTGATQSITPDFSDTDCWPDGGPGGTGNDAGITISAVGNAPATFNSYFEKGVVFTVPAMGLTYSIAANLSGDNIEFIANELWSDTGRGGVMSGSINKTTGALKFEGRQERIVNAGGCGDTDQSCGWNRHTRIYADLSVDASGNPNGVKSIDFAYSDVATPASGLATPSNTTSRGTLITTRGTVAAAVKSRLFSISSVTDANLLTVGNWTEVTNNACGTGGAGIADAGNVNCSGTQAGIGKFADPSTFILRGTFKAHADWLTQFGGFNFSSINLDSDIAYAAK